MHHNENPFAPKNDTPTNVLMFENPSEVFDNILTTNPEILKLPEDCRFCKISLTDNKQEIIDFINRNHGNGVWKLNITAKDLDYLTEVGNAAFYGIRWRGLLIALASMELFNIKAFDSKYKAAFVDFSTVHPKFRKTGIYNILLMKIIRESITHDCVIGFFCGHTKIDCKPYAVKPSYIYPLSDIPYNCNLTEKRANAPFRIHKQTLKQPTLDDLRQLNDNPAFDVHIIYSDDILSMMLKYYRIYTNGQSVLCYVPIVMMINNITVKYAVLFNWVNINCNIFKESVEELRKEGFDAISFTSEGELKELLLNIPFEKKEDVYFYTMNILPKARKGRINLTVR